MTDQTRKAAHSLYEQAIDSLEQLVEMYAKKDVTNEKFGQTYSYFLAQQAMHIIAQAALHPSPVPNAGVTDRTKEPIATLKNAKKRSAYPWSGDGGYTAQDYKNEGAIDFAVRLLEYMGENHE